MTQEASIFFERYWRWQSFDCLHLCLINLQEIFEHLVPKQYFMFDYNYIFSVHYLPYIWYFSDILCNV